MGTTLLVLAYVVLTLVTIGSLALRRYIMPVPTLDAILTELLDAVRHLRREERLSRSVHADMLFALDRLERGGAAFKVTLEELKQLVQQQGEKMSTVKEEVAALVAAVNENTNTIAESTATSAAEVARVVAVIQALKDKLDAAGAGSLSAADVADVKVLLADAVTKSQAVEDNLKTVTENLKALGADGTITL